MNAPFFRPGDRWMAFGDSITEGGRYMAGVEYFIRCWGGRISFQNAGLGGDTSRGAGRTDNQVWLQYVMSLGAHGAH